MMGLLLSHVKPNMGFRFRYAFPTMQNDGALATEPVVNVAITGALRQPRSKVAELINSTANGRFVESITYDTHYLVTTLATSKKVIKAARLGTAVISEDELRAYITDGRFPSTQLPVRPSYSSNNFPDIAWSYKTGRGIYLLTYCDANGNTTVRQVLATATGYSKHEPCREWLGGYDGPVFKTWRRDRIVELEFLGPEAESFSDDDSVDALP